MVVVFAEYQQIGHGPENKIYLTQEFAVDIQVGYGILQYTGGGRQWWLFTVQLTIKPCSLQVRVTRVQCRSTMRPA